jgi:hypothetical protein
MRAPAFARPRRPLRLPCRAAAASLAAFVALSTIAAAPAAAFDLFATHQVTAHFATADGKPLAGAAVSVFAPGEATTPVASGRTDAAGKFVFDADREGMWSAEARTPNEVARITIRVGEAAAGQGEREGGRRPLFVIGGLGLLLVAAVWYRRRMRRRQPKS